MKRLDSFEWYEALYKRIHKLYETDSVKDMMDTPKMSQEDLDEFKELKLKHRKKIFENMTLDDEK